MSDMPVEPVSLTETIFGCAILGVVGTTLCTGIGVFIILAASPNRARGATRSMHLVWEHRDAEISKVVAIARQPESR